MGEESSSPFPMTTPALLAQAGILPIRKGPARFAVGPPNRLTSNSWKVWSNGSGDIYIACRDNFKEVKVSLHASGRWRMGFTTEALTKNPSLLPPEQNRAWEVWDKPPPALPNTTIAFRLVFPTSELAVRPEQRPARQWRGVFYIEAAPPGKLTILTLFVTEGDVVPTHESEPSFCVASLAIGGNRHAQLVAHADPEGNIPELIERAVVEARGKVEASGQQMPVGGYIYMLGRFEDGSRYVVGAHANR
jgi:hypothetical protein